MKIINDVTFRKHLVQIWIVLDIIITYFIVYLIIMLVQKNLGSRTSHKLNKSIFEKKIRDEVASFIE